MFREEAKKRALVEQEFQAAKDQMLAQRMAD
jgi:hypothetical protein